MSSEQIRTPKAGWGMLALVILSWLSAFTLIIWGAVHESVQEVLAGFVLLPISAVASCSFIVLQPNTAAVLLLFGRYMGTVRSSGFWCVNPFYSKRKISLRLQNLNGERLKVNDKAGNPIEIAAIVVWKVADTYAAKFEVEDYVAYVKIQSESALRHLASLYPYDSWEAGDKEITLRGGIDEVSTALVRELHERLSKAGVVVIEARLSHLAYAQEIAEAMLRRQQASAVVSARQKIVEGAVGMVGMALELLKADHVVELDAARQAAMVSNLLVVLCSESNAQPIVNAGTLYQ